MGNIKGEIEGRANTSLGMEQPPPEPKSSSNAKKGMDASGSVSKGSLPSGQLGGIEQPAPKAKSSSVG
jgi:hypothetical protein